MFRKNGRIEKGRKNRAMKLAPPVLEVLESRQLLSTYYVAPTGSDTSAGTSAAPWQTLQEASNNVQAGDTVIVKAGTYAGIDFTDKNGTANARITFKADPGVVINKPAAYAGVVLWHSSYITIDGFTINASGMQTGILSGSSDYISLQNNTIDGAGTWGIQASMSDYIDIGYNKVSNTQWQHGIYVSDQAYKPYIHDNYLYHNNYTGIQLNGDIASSGGSVSDPLGGIIYGAIVERNVLIDNSQGSWVHMNMDGVQSSIIRNNIIYSSNGHGNGISIYQIDGGHGSKNNVVVGNTIVNVGQSAVTITGGTEPSSGNKVFDNILYGNARTLEPSTINIDAASLEGFQSDYNIITGRYGHYVSYQQTDFVDFANWTSPTAAWKGSTPNMTQLDAHSVVVSNDAALAALFVNLANADLHLRAGSLAIDKGTPVSELLTDLEGTARPQGAGYDMGAYEYGGVVTPTAPAAPSGLTASAASATQINLTWADNSTNETGFKIERMAAGGTWSLIASVGAGVTSYSNTGLSASTAYSFRVSATNAVGDSGYSNTASATTQAVATAPVAPSSLTASALNTTQITLSWVDNSNNETGFKVERMTGATWSQIGTVAAGVTTFADSGLSASTAYSYRVRATNAVGDSAYSNTATATTLAPAAPAAPSALAATVMGSSQISLKWTDNSSDETGFKLERMAAGGTWAQIAALGAGVTTYADSGLSASTAYSYRVRATNAVGDSAYSNTASATTIATGTTSIWTNSTTPAVAAATDDTAQVELGLKFSASVAGYVSGVRFYKGATNTGTHTGHLWSSTGQLLATVTFSGETASGWQQAMFSQPVAITANTTYVISYNAPNGNYAYNTSYFTTAGLTSGSLKAINSVFAYGANGFPSNTWQNANYWVDVMFNANAAPTPTVPAAPSALTATAASSSQITLKWTDNSSDETGFKIERLSGTVWSQIATVAAGVVSYSNTGLTASTSYSYRVRANNAAGDSAYSNTASATTLAAPVPTTTYSLFSTTAVPSILADSDTVATEVGVRFKSSVAGTITGLRFYKAVSNTGTHVGHLWTSAGALLASATFTNETASGWQTVTFSQPVAIQANVEYVASYNAPKGQYSVNVSYFTSAGLTNGPLTAINSVYSYGTNVFPSSTWQNANYWVDVIFKSA